MSSKPKINLHELRTKFVDVVFPYGQFVWTAGYKHKANDIYEDYGKEAFIYVQYVLNDLDDDPYYLRITEYGQVEWYLEAGRCYYPVTTTPYQVHAPLTNAYEFCVHVQTMLDNGTIFDVSKHRIDSDEQFKPNIIFEEVDGEWNVF